MVNGISSDPSQFINSANSINNVKPCEIKLGGQKQVTNKNRIKQSDRKKRLYKQANISGKANEGNRFQEEQKQRIP